MLGWLGQGCRCDGGIRCNTWITCRGLGSKEGEREGRVDNGWFGSGGRGGKVSFDAFVAKTWLLPLGMFVWYPSGGFEVVSCVEVVGV